MWHRLVIHRLAGCGQHCQDNSAFAPIHDVMRVIAQMDSSTFEAHGRGIRIGGAHPKISGSPVEAMDFPLLPTFFRDPVVSSSIVCRKFFKLGLGDDGREKRGLLVGKRCVTAVFFGTLRRYRFWRKKGGDMLSD